MLKARQKKALDESKNEPYYLDFLRGCPYFTDGSCNSVCWNLNGPCGVCVKEGKYNPKNATKNEVINAMIANKMESESR